MIKDQQTNLNKMIYSVFDETDGNIVAFLYETDGDIDEVVEDMINCVISDDCINLKKGTIERLLLEEEMKDNLTITFNENKTHCVVNRDRGCLVVEVGDVLEERLIQ